MSDQTTSNVPLDDELPAPPIGPGTSTPQQQAEPVDGSMDASLFEEVPKFGEALPKGTYHFRLDRFSEMWQEPDKNNPEELLFGKQPQFMLFWSCQEEPHTGQSFVDFMQWVSREVQEQAKAGNRAAMALLRTRLSRSKALIQAAEYPISGNFDFKSFLATHPEVKIQLGLREKKTKNQAGELTGTGEMANNAIKYMSLRQPR